ncbi:MAG: hypothetical protein P1U34_05795 [Coxiellaceae bacterium]|nr:hypothetical protein [Coxiellaceae bacterium]
MLQNGKTKQKSGNGRHAHHARKDKPSSSVCFCLTMSPPPAIIPSAQASAKITP